MNSSYSNNNRNNNNNNDGDKKNNNNRQEADQIERRWKNTTHVLTRMPYKTIAF